MRLFLVRETTDLKEDSTDNIERAGQFLANYFHTNPSNINSLINNPLASTLMKGFTNSTLGKFANPEQLEQAAKLKARIWNAPNENARACAKLIEGISRNHISSIREDVLLAERMTGHMKDPDSHKICSDLNNDYGLFRAKYPHGESLFDVSCRLRLFFNTLRLDRDDENINDVIIIADAHILNLISMMWLGKTPEWFLDEPEEAPASIRLIEDTEDRGYVSKPPE